jgi:hypothetical protein
MFDVYVHYYCTLYQCCGSGLIESGSGYGSRDPNESGSNPDPDQDTDPQHCTV